MKAKKDLSVHFSSKTDDWATPQDTFDKLNQQYGPFDLDVCASTENAKCSRYYTEERSGLNQEWHFEFPGENPPRCWMNPPYGREIGKWIKKAYEESQKGCLVVCLLPARTDTKWFHTYINNRPNCEVSFLKGRLRFGSAVNSAPFPSMVVVFNPSKGRHK